MIELGLRLGRTANELKATLTRAELAEYLAFYGVWPFGERRADIRAAQQTAATVAAAGGKGGIEDFLPFRMPWEQDEADEAEDLTLQIDAARMAAEGKVPRGVDPLLWARWSRATARAEAEAAGAA